MHPTFHHKRPGVMILYFQFRQLEVPFIQLLLNNCKLRNGTIKIPLTISITFTMLNCTRVKLDQTVTRGVATYLERYLCTPNLICLNSSYARESKIGR